LKNFSTLLSIGLFGLYVASAHADQISVLGTADSFAVLGASTVTNTGPTVLSGNLGVYPGTAITGFPPGIVINGSTYAGTATAMTAQADALNGYTYLAGLAPTQVLTGQDLGGLVLAPGVYFFASSAQLTGPLTLDFGGVNDANIVFQIGSTLTTASGSTVSVINQGLNDNVYYQIGSSATLGTNSLFAGDILANTSITLTTGVDISCGAAIALNGAVTLDSNKVTNCSSTGSNVTPVGSGGTGPIAPTPEPGSLVLLGTSLLGAAGVLRQRVLA
jgi:type VI secretion system secreted protein VgrG